MQSRMHKAGIGRTVRRGVAVAVLGWLVAMTGSVLAAPSAGAAPTADVVIRDLTPPLVSIDPGGTVTFSNEIADKNVQVGGGGLVSSLVTVVVHTDVTLTLPSGNHPLPRGQKVAERFADSCLVGCFITYTHRAEVPSSSLIGSALNTVTGNALAKLPQNQVVTYNGKQTTVTLGVPTPFVVNTLVPLPNLPSVNLPTLPQVDVAVPVLPEVTPPAAPLPTGDLPVAEQPAPAPAPIAQVPSIGGPTYSYGTPAAAAQLSPTGAAGAAFDASRVSVPGSTGHVADAGSGGVPGSYDGASVPVFGQLAGLGDPLADGGEEVEVVSDAADLTAPQLSVPALLAVIALAGVTSMLVHTHRAQRAGR